MLSRDSRWPQVGILLLVFELLTGIGLGKIPPVTLATIGLQIGLFLRGLERFLGRWTLWPTDSLCLNANIIVQHDQFYRIFTAPLFHGSDIHLYYNMVSFAWKGVHLERRYGSIGFALLLLFMTGLTGFIYVGLSLATSQYLHDDSFANQCAIGFSGIVFALKVLADDSDGHFGLFTVPKKMAIWMELLIIQILVPNSSFIGHASGVIAGITIAHLLPAFVYVTFQVPFEMFNRSPLTLVVGGALSAFYFDLVKRPWKTKSFWSSGTPLVCLNSNSVFAKGEYFRLISGPLEHAGGVHFTICFISLLLKLYQLEQKYSVIKTITLAATSVFVTSFLYCLIQTFFASHHECVQGLSGPSFALKVLVLFSGCSSWPLLLFEVAEMLIILEERTFLYHLSGIICGFLVWMIFAKPEPFPGQGMRLGHSSSASTRSWGYSHYTDDQFRRVVEAETHENPSSISR